MKQPVVLKISKLDKLEAVRQFEQNQIVIGRSSDVQLDLQDEGVALLHAMIEDRDGEYFVSDLGSQNGTFRNGTRILEDKLVSGDQLAIGPYRIHFFVGVPKPAAPPKIAPKVAPDVSEAPQAVAYSTTVTEAPKVIEPEAKEVQTSIPPVVATTSESKTPKPVDVQNHRPKNKPKNIVQKHEVMPPPDIPEAKKIKAGSALGVLGKPSKKTFAPLSPYKDLQDIIKPHKGSVVEVIVAWQDRILSTNHFSEKGSVFISSNADADVVVPIISSTSRYELVKIGTQVSICLAQEMTGELIRNGENIAFSELSRQNKLRNAGSHYELDLNQGEMVRISLQDNLVTIFIRFVAETPKPLVAPLLDMTSSEVTGVILALAISSILALYMNIYTPSPLLEDEAKIEEPIRKAIVTFNPPKPRQVVEVQEAPPQEKKVVVVKEKPRQTPTPSVEKAGNPGKAGEVAPKPSPIKEKKVTSARPGGAIKTSPKEGASAKSQKPDPTKVGLLGVFSSKGTQSKLDKAYSGSGELQGMADAATGHAGNAEDRAGDNLGTKLKDTGAGGKGSSTVGIAGVGTTGRGTGTTGYGSGGIGKKGSAQINVGGQDGDFVTGMDREAIRRVIREHIREIRNCYERELQRSPDLYGKLVLEWDIEEGGKVSRCVVKSNALGNDAVANCIATRLKQWKFPDPPKDVIGRVSYPFVFSSQ